MSAEQTRDRILDAALKLFSQKGFLGATTRGIARDAGVAEVTLFRHFGSKEKLFEEVIRGYSFLPAMKGILPGRRRRRDTRYNRGMEMSGCVRDRAQDEMRRQKL